MTQQRLWCVSHQSTHFCSIESIARMAHARCLRLAAAVVALVAPQRAAAWSAAPQRFVPPPSSAFALRGGGVTALRSTAADGGATTTLPTPPNGAPATSPLGTPNRFWEWRGQQIRYQAMGLEENPDGPSLLLVHGLFVNADHWRRNLPALAAAGFRVFAIDLLGSGYSSKPPPCGEVARALSGETRRGGVAPLAGVELGTASGGTRTADVALAHPLGSCYNFFTYAACVLCLVSRWPRSSNRFVVGSVATARVTPPRTDRFTRGIVIVTVSPPWGCAAARFVSRHRRRRRAVGGPTSSRTSRTRSSLRRAARPRSCATRLGPSPRCRRVARCFPHACAVVDGTVPVGGRCKNVCIAAAGRGRRECGGRGRRRRRRKAAALRRRVRRQPELP